MLCKKRVSVVGSTGSVGSSAYSVIKQNKDIFEVEALIAKSNYKLLSQQAKDLQAEMVFIEDKIHYQDLLTELQGSDIKVFAGKQEIIDFLEKSNTSDTLLIASSGYESIPYFYGALKGSKNIAMANKEAIVCGGSFATNFINVSNAKVIPVDSEHSALFQSMIAGDRKEIESLVITASGGSFVDYSLEELSKVTKEQALKHPTWDMGKKITIDSSTLVNKALEVMEASYLFDIDESNIEVLIHRQSILHGGVNYKDGSFIGHFSYPSMEIPVAYGLFYPHRINTSVKRLNLAEISQLKFESLCEKRFKAIHLARESLRGKKNYSCVLNVANEVAVDAFLNDKINFNKIIDVIEYSLNKVTPLDINNISDIYQSVEISKAIAIEYINKIR